MEYILKHKLLNSYLTNEKTNGDFIKSTRKIDEAEKFKSIEEANQFIKKMKLRSKDYIVLEIEV